MSKTLCLNLTIVTTIPFFLFLSCNPMAPKTFTSTEARSELQTQFSNAFELNLPNSFQITESAYLPHGERAEIFKIKASPEVVAAFHQSLLSKFDSKSGFIVKREFNPVEVPLGVGDRHNPFTKAGISWWAPWDMKDKIIFDLRVKQDGLGIWFCISVEEGTILILSWNS